MSKPTTPPPDVLYMIRARLDAGRSKGAPQLTKDIRVLGKAADEIVRLRAKVAELDGRLGQRPCQHTRCAAYLTLETELVRLRTRIEALRTALCEVWRAQDTDTWADFLRLSFRADRGSTMTPSHEKILRALRTHGELNCRQVAQKAHVSLSTARQKATWAPLIEAGLVSERLEQRNQGAPWRYYAATHTHAAATASTAARKSGSASSAAPESIDRRAQE